MAMEFPQTTYARTYSTPQSGSLGDAGGHRLEGYTNDEGTDIPAGIAVTLKAEGTIEEYDNTSDAVLGLTVFSEAVDPTGLSGEDHIKDGAVCDVMTEGAMWVQVEEAIAVTDAVYVRATSDGGSNTQLGRFRNDSDSGKCALLKAARWLSSGSSGGRALLYFSKAADMAANA